MVDAALLPVLDTARSAEAQTIARACTGDQRAFERLYRTHAAWVFGLCLRLTGDREHAQDCTQEAFVAAWRALPKFERRSQFASWLHRIAINVVLSRRKRAASGQSVSAEEHSEEVPAIAEPVDTGGSIDVERAIAALPRGARDVLVLVGLFGYRHDEAADMLGIAEGTSKAQLHRARALLSSQLGLSSVSI